MVVLLETSLVVVLVILTTALGAVLGVVVVSLLFKMHQFNNQFIKRVLPINL